MIVVSHFLKWVHTAKVAERAAAAAALARAYVDRDLPFEDRCAAEAALTLLLDDPSSKVRLALAETLSMSHHAPAQIVQRSPPTSRKWRRSCCRAHRCFPTPT